MANTNPSPNSSTTTTTTTAPPAGTSTQQQQSNTNIYTYLNHIQTQQTNLETRINDSNQELTRIKTDIKNQSSRNIEVIGIFSSVLALLIINVNVVLSATDILSAILLIIGLTASVSIFALLIHHFFNTHIPNTLNKLFWIPVLILALLLVFGIMAELGILNKKSLSLKKDEQKKESVIINNNIQGQKNNMINSSDTIKTTINQKLEVIGDSIIVK